MDGRTDTPYRDAAYHRKRKIVSDLALIERDDENLENSSGSLMD